LEHPNVAAAKFLPGSYCSAAAFPEKWFVYGFTEDILQVLY
jgi:hypothetical protein